MSLFVPLGADEHLPDVADRSAVGSHRWQLSERDGGTIPWHNGRTGGYSAFVGLSRKRGRAVVVLSDVATDRTDERGMRLARAR